MIKVNINEVLLSDLEKSKKEIPQNDFEELNTGSTMDTFDNYSKEIEPGEYELTMDDSNGNWVSGDIVEIPNQLSPVKNIADTDAYEISVNDIIVYVPIEYLKSTGNIGEKPKECSHDHKIQGGGLGKNQTGDGPHNNTFDMAGAEEFLNKIISGFIEDEGGGGGDGGAMTSTADVAGYESPFTTGKVQKRNKMTEDDLKIDEDGTDYSWTFGKIKNPKKKSELPEVDDELVKKFKIHSPELKS